MITEACEHWFKVIGIAILGTMAKRLHEEERRKRTATIQICVWACQDTLTLLGSAQSKP